MSDKFVFRQDLQGLRAIAVLLVVFCHAGFVAVEGGFIGVDIFFVLSGYLITGLLLKEHDSTGKIGFLNFYARRIKRLLPSLFLVILVTFLCASFLLSGYEFIAKTRSSFYALTWVSNLYFAVADIGYFAEIEQQDLFLHTWSLGVEEQFYVVWPALIFSSLALSRMLGKRKEKTLGTVLLLSFLGSLLLCLFWSMEQPVWAFYMMPSRVWQFSLGALVCVLSPRFRLFMESGKNLSALQLGPIAVILLCAYLITDSMSYPGWLALIPSLAAAVIMAFPPGVAGTSILAWKPFVYIGDRSYAWYLWHWPVFSIANSCGVDVFVYQKFGLIAVCFLLAMFSYKFVEIPFWKGRFSKHSNPRTLIAALLAALALVTVMLKFLSYHQSKAQEDSNIQISAAVNDIPIIYSYGCDSWYSSAEVKPCVFEGDEPKKTFVLFGDSVLGQWFSLFAEIYSPPEWRFILVTKSACPIVDEDFYYSRINAVYDVCRIWRNAVLIMLREFKPDVVVIGNAVNYEFSEEQWVQGSSRLLEQLSKVSPKVFVLVGTPRLGRNGPACLLKNSSSLDEMRNDCIGTEAMDQVDKVRGYLARASEKYNGVHLLDFNGFVCPGGQCFAIDPEGVVVFRDSQHLTDTFVKNQLEEILNKYPELK
jgi:peptidoglycan/LPS O-acetylase OafA/YrhL